MHRAARQAKRGDRIRKSMREYTKRWQDFQSLSSRAILKSVGHAGAADLSAVEIGLAGSEGGLRIRLYRTLR